MKIGTEIRPGSPEAAGMLPERVALARDLCARWVKEGHTPTLGVCAARRGVIVLHEAFGVLGPGASSPPLGRDALFPVMSITKPITATLVMQLVEDGLLGLNRPVRDYLPEISGDGAGDILVHHLLTHTSGYPWEGDPLMIEHAERKKRAGVEPPPCPERQRPVIHELLWLLWDAPRVAGVGEVMNYSSHNYELLGEIVRRLSGRDLDELARERIFAPLGMQDSYYVVPEPESQRVVQRAPGLPLADAAPPYEAAGSRQMQENPYAGVGVFSTPRDLVVFGQMFLNGGCYGEARVLSPAAVAAMTRNQAPGLRARVALWKEIENASWGYGFGIASPTKWKYFDGSLHALGAFCHPGAGGSMLWIDPHNELVIAYFEITTRVTEEWEFVWNFDLFQNAITAAVED
jgi:CubicO group peptidase (beta-lactamase class C family)